MKDLALNFRIYGRRRGLPFAGMQVNEQHEWAPTRMSLIERLKNRGDDEGWRTFFETYWRLIYGAAMKAGLSDAEAQDVVQETTICVCQRIPDFKYDKAKGSFKGWLLKLTSWRISDQLNDRQKGIRRPSGREFSPDDTGTIDQIADPAIPALEAVWDEEWENNQMQVLVDRVKKKVDARHYQIFDLYFCKQWPVARVARMLNVSRATVYVIRHRVGNVFKQELKNFQEKPI